jgi:hypothetical protein
MTLTSEQAKTLADGGAVPLTIEQTPCVIVRQDVFERLRSVDYDDSEWTDEELMLLVSRTFADVDQAGPIS